MELPPDRDAKPSSPLVRLPSELISYAYFICVVIMGYEVVMRYGFNAPRLWVQDTVVMLVGSCFALGGIVVLYEGAHIRITAIYDNVPEALQRWLDVLAALVSMLYLGLLTYGAWANAQMSWRLWETTGTGWNSPLPMVLKTALLVSAGLMAIVATVQVIHSIKRIRG